MKLTGPQLKPLARVLLTLDKEGIVPLAVLDTDDGYILVQLQQTYFEISPSGFKAERVY